MDMYVFHVRGGENKMNRKEHLGWCKKRALEYVEMDDLVNAYGSMVSDLTKHPETIDHPALGMGIALMANGNLNTKNEMRDFIEGFN